MKKADPALRSIGVKIVGTGFGERANLIRRSARQGMPVYLVREPGNPYDVNAISVQIRVRRFFGLVDLGLQPIGYLARLRAASLARRMDAGETVTAVIRHFDVPVGRDGARVSLTLTLPARRCSRHDAMPSERHPTEEADDPNLDERVAV